MTTMTFGTVPGTVDDRPTMLEDVVIEQLMQTVADEGTELDPTWRFVDAVGHGHFTLPAERGPDRLPTLIWTITRTWFCEDCNDEHEDGEYRCRFCEEPIEPGTRRTGPVTILTGRRFSARVPLDALGPVAIGPSVARKTYTVNVGGELFDCYGTDVTMTRSGGGSALLVGHPHTPGTEDSPAST